MKKNPLRTLLPLIIALLFPVAAYAHPGTLLQHIFINGVIHPFTGFDHLLAMLGIGMWISGSSRKIKLTMLPLAAGTIVLSMFTASHLGVLSQLDLWLAVSVVILGALMAFRFNGSTLMRVGTSLGIVFLHAYAHGIESIPGQPMLGYSLGIALSSAFLMAIGLAGGSYLRHRHPALFRSSGWALIAAGAGLMFGF